MFMRGLLWLCVAGLYFGIAGTLGVFVRGARVWRVQRGEGWMPLVFALVMWGPATVLVVCLPGSPLGGRIAILFLGLAVLLANAFKPRWLPAEVWSLALALGYLALVMGLSMTWALGTSLGMPSLATALVGMAAGLASLSTALAAIRRRKLRASFGQTI